jgi:hypothetical protein
MANRATLYRCQNTGCNQTTNSDEGKTRLWFELEVYQIAAETTNSEPSRVCVITPLVLPSTRGNELVASLENLPLPLERFDLCGPACLTSAMNRVLAPDYKVRTLALK